MTWRTGTKNPHNLYFDLGAESIPHGFLIEPGIAQRIAEAMNAETRQPSRWAEAERISELERKLAAAERRCLEAEGQVDHWRKAWAQARVEADIKQGGLLRPFTEGEQAAPVDFTRTKGAAVLEADVSASSEKPKAAAPAAAAPADRTEAHEHGYVMRSGGPVFFTDEEGPAFVFYPIVSYVRLACLIGEHEHDVELQPADVEQLRDFLDEWLAAPAGASTERGRT